MKSEHSMSCHSAGDCMDQLMEFCSDAARDGIRLIAVLAALSA